MSKKKEKKPSGYWTFENVKKESEKYNTKTEFRINSSEAYYSARYHKWYEDVTKHMVQVTKPSGYWTYERVKEEAKKYETPTDFFSGSSAAFQLACKNKWIEEFTKHMNFKRNRNGYWTFEKVKEESEKYKTKTEFRKNGKGAYQSAYRNNWLDDVTKHMDIIGNRKKRMIYSFKFSDNSVYVGLTYNEKERYGQHMINVKSPVYKHMTETGLVPEFKKETDFLSNEEAVKMEKYMEDLYRQDGWKILNINKTGGLGNNGLIWTFDKVKQEAEKYGTKSKFIKGSPGAYSSAYRNKWYYDVTKHMIEKERKPRGYWTYDKVEEDAKKYKTRKEFMKGSPTAYVLSHKNSLLNDTISSIFPKEEKNPNGYWTYERVKEEAKKYNTRKKFQTGSSSAYISSRKNGWLDDITTHMEQCKNPNGYWTYERVKEEAKKYNTRNEFQNNCGSAHFVARKNNWLDDVTKHMERKRKPKGYWTYDSIKQEAKKYDTRNKFQIGSNGAYKFAYKNNFLDDITKHMDQKNRKPKGYWTFELVKKNAEKYNTIGEFYKNCKGGYSSAYKNNWLDDVTKHMKVKK